MGRQGAASMGFLLLVVAGSASAPVKTRQVDFSVTYATASGEADTLSDEHFTISVCGARKGRDHDSRRHGRLRMDGDALAHSSSKVDALFEEAP